MCKQPRIWIPNENFLILFDAIFDQIEFEEKSYSSIIK